MINIFNKSYNDVDYNDLQNLVENHVKEGWFIEYKEIFLSTKKIAKSISSFANSEGGYYLVGIKESIENDKNEAEEIVGFDNTEKSKPYETISNAIKDHINPIPKFYTQLIDIPNNKQVLLVYIPEGTNPPYLCDGSIYQRVGEVTDPISIKDRYFLDKLYEKADNNFKKITNFCQNDITILNQSKLPLLEFYSYISEPMLIEDFFCEDKLKVIKDIFTEKSNIFPSDIDSEINVKKNYHLYITQSFDSYIFENIIDEIHIFCEIFPTGNCKIIMNIPFKSFLNFELNFESSKGSYNLIRTELLKKGYKLVENGKLKHFDDEELPKLIDIKEFFYLFSVIFNKYLKFTKLFDKNIEERIHFKFNIKNCENSVPLIFDSDKFKNYIENYGLPFCYKKNNVSDLFDFSVLQLNFNDSDVPLDEKYNLSLFFEFMVMFGFLTVNYDILIDELVKVLL